MYIYIYIYKIYIYIYIYVNCAFFHLIFAVPRLALPYFSLKLI